MTADTCGPDIPKAKLYWIQTMPLSRPLLITVTKVYPCVSILHYAFSIACQIFHSPCTNSCRQLRKEAIYARPSCLTTTLFFAMMIFAMLRIGLRRPDPFKLSLRVPRHKFEVSRSACAQHAVANLRLTKLAPV